MMTPTHYSPTINPPFAGLKPPPTSAFQSPEARWNYFQNFRNERLSRLQGKRYEWGDIYIKYNPKSDVASLNKTNNLSQFTKMPQSQFSMLDAGRQLEIDNFYMACQDHRDQYKNHLGQLHPLGYFKNSDFKYQCAPDATSKYLKTPEYYVKYKSPQTLAVTFERSYKSPLLPQRALTGRYNPISDITYKR